MNRELRRAQAKAEAKAAKEKQRAKQEKRAKRQAAVARRSRPKSAKPSTKQQGDEPAPRQDTFFARLGRMVAFPVTVGFIILQGITPILVEVQGTQEAFQERQFAPVIEVLYYALLGYFLFTWLARRGVSSALYLASGIGAALAIGLVGAQFIAAQQFPTLVPNLQLFYFGIPAVIAGAFLGQVVWTRAPR